MIKIKLANYLTCVKYLTQQNTKPCSKKIARRRNRRSTLTSCKRGTCSLAQAPSLSDETYAKLAKVHNATVGHLGVERTMFRPKHFTTASYGLMKKLSMDCLGRLKETEDGYTHILAIIDNFSRYVGLYPIKSSYSFWHLRLPRNYPNG